MIAKANQKTIRNILRRCSQKDKLNILSYCAHERCEQNICKSGHNFYSLEGLSEKKWDTDYGDVPENYNIISEIPNDINFDLILWHMASNPQLAKSLSQDLNIPVVVLVHTLPNVTMPLDPQIQEFKKSWSSCMDRVVFISEYSKKAWMYDEDNAVVIEHGMDIDFWSDQQPLKRDNACLSVVNDWPNRDWCCGFNLWKQTAQGLPVKVFGKSPGFSEPARSTEHLREIYHSSKIFYNTSLHSPVPSVLLEAMACGCAVVSTATCMIPEIIDHGVNGLISNDPNELRSYLELLLQNDDIAKKLGESAKHTVKEKYNVARYAKDWNTLFEKTIDSYR